MSLTLLVVSALHGGFASILAPRVANKAPDLGFMDVVKRIEPTPPCAWLRCPTVTPVAYNTRTCALTTCPSPPTTTTSALPVPPGVCGVATDPTLTATGCPDVDYLCTKTKYIGLTQCPPVPCTSTTGPPTVTVTTTVYVTPTGPTTTTSTGITMTTSSTTSTSTSTSSTVTTV